MDLNTTKHNKSFLCRRWEAWWRTYASMNRETYCMYLWDVWHYEKPDKTDPAVLHSLELEVNWHQIKIYVLMLFFPKEYT